MRHQMNISAVIRSARQHVRNGAAMESSARLCLADAVRLYDAEDLDGARAMAVRSLKYSVGILSPVYRAALPNDTVRETGRCKHGVYVGGIGIDWMCGQCEMGE